MSLHRARNVVVHLYYSFQLRPLAVAWQNDKLESANFLKFRNHIFGVFLALPVGKHAICCGLATCISVGLRCLRSAMHCVFSQFLSHGISEEDVLMPVVSVETTKMSGCVVQRPEGVELCHE